eukprot:13864636-Alexandrium_andersonii.AAC.1
MGVVVSEGRLRACALLRAACASPFSLFFQYTSPRRARANADIRMQMGRIFRRRSALTGLCS